MSDLTFCLWAIAILQGLANAAMATGLICLCRYVYLCERVRELKEQLESEGGDGQADG